MRKSRLPSPAMIVAVAALFVALGGTGYAASQLADKNSDKQLINSLAPSLSVAHARTAGNASTLGGRGAGQYLTASSRLASRHTETGVFAASAATGGVGTSEINFIPKLPGAIPAGKVHELLSAATDSHCSGVDHAAPGYLCIYEGWNFDMTFTDWADPYSSVEHTAIPPVGTVLIWNSSDTIGNVRGTWAYTAP